jgi:hypothetical protein
MEASILNNMSADERYRGNFAAAIDYAERALASHASADQAPVLEALMRLNLGLPKLRAGADPKEVHPLFVEALDCAEQARSPMIVAWTLGCLAHTTAAFNPESAARLLGTANAVRLNHQLVLDVNDRVDFDFARHQVEIRMGPMATQAIIESVGDVSIDQAIEVARRVISALLNQGVAAPDRPPVNE